MRVPEPKRIAILSKPGTLPFIDIIRGAKSYCHPHSWRLLTRDPTDAGAMDWLAKQEVDGMIVHVARREHLERCLQLAVPTVNTSGRFSPAELAGMPCITLRIDERAAGAMAAKHLLDVGLEHFGVLGVASQYYSVERYEGFRQALTAQRHTCEVFWADRADPHDRCSKSADEPPEQVMAAFVASLPKPCGILATDPGYGDRLCDLAAMYDLAVPAEVAIISGHDNDIAAHCAVPGLSAVQLPLEQLGYRGGETLNLLISGKKPVKYRPLKPLGVQARDSTDTLATGDPAVRKAITFIRRNALGPCMVSDVIDAAGCSRSYLDRAFRDTLGHTVFTAIRNQKIAAAKNMLARTDETVEAIAVTCGFSGGMRFSQVFKEVVGQSPSQYRRQFHKRSAT